MKYFLSLESNESEAAVVGKLRAAGLAVVSRREASADVAGMTLTLSRPVSGAPVGSENERIGREQAAEYYRQRIAQIESCNPSKAN